MRAWLPATALVATALAALLAAASADVRLSTERSVTRWAHANLLAKVRAKPSTHSRTMARLRWQTEDGPPEVYVVLQQPPRQGRDVDEDPDSRGRPNGRTGWVRDEALGGLHEIHTALTIDQRTLTATLTKRGRVIWSLARRHGRARHPDAQGASGSASACAGSAAPTARGRSGRVPTRTR